MAEEDLERAEEEEEEEDLIHHHQIHYTIMPLIFYISLELTHMN